MLGLHCHERRTGRCRGSRIMTDRERLFGQSRPGSFALHQDDAPSAVAVATTSGNRISEGPPALGRPSPLPGVRERPLWNVDYGQPETGFSRLPFGRRWSVPRGSGILKRPYERAEPSAPTVCALAIGRCCPCNPVGKADHLGLSQRRLCGDQVVPDIGNDLVRKWVDQ